MAYSLSIYDYLDYRAYLRDYYAAQKSMGEGFSFRVFARRAELRSPNYLKLVMEGKRNLTSDMAYRFAIACDLGLDEASYFVDLVAFNQAKHSHAREALYAKLIRYRGHRRVHKLESERTEYHSKWYFPVIRKLIDRPDFEEDPSWIGRQLVPAVPRAQVSKALKNLEKTGFIKRDENNRLVLATPSEGTSSEAQEVHEALHQRAMIERASEAIDLITPDQRDISSLTLCLGPEGLKRLRGRLQRFRQELLELSEHEPEGETVAQVNLQLFPLSK